MKSNADMAVLTENGIQVFPSANEIPANLLRFHLRFDDVPDVFDIGTAIRLVDACDVPVDHVFLDLNEGLWSADGLTLTVMLHPGRIKTGLVASRNLGNAFREYDEYELQLRREHLPVLQRCSPASAGAANGWVRIKRFTATPAVDTVIEPQSLLLSLPSANCFTPLSITFPHIVDRLAIENYVQLDQLSEAPLRTQIEVGDAERTIHFFPQHAWPAVPLALHFSRDFEDICGNRFSSAFAHVAQAVNVDTHTTIPLFLKL